MKRPATILGLTCALVMLVWGQSAVALGRTGGDAWNTQSSGTPVNLTAVSFPAGDASHGWAVGTDRTILATTNGGAQWSVQASGGTYPPGLEGVCFLDATHGWVVGRSGAYGVTTILATTDGGAHWDAQGLSIPWYPSNDLYSVSFPDASHGWAVGWCATGGESILATTDGGANWNVQSSGTGARLYSVSFPAGDASHGWAVGEQGRILATTDGGVHWVAQDSGGDYWTDLSSVSFPDASHGWAVGTWEDTHMVWHGLILATTDGGANWTARTPSTVTQLHGVYFRDASHGWATGGIGYNGWITLILATTDGGVHWNLQNPNTTVFLNAVCFPDTSNGWAVGAGGLVEATACGGSVPDTVPPTTQAPSSASARRGRNATLKYRVTDALPNNGLATVTLKVKNRAGRVKMTLPQYVKAVNTTFSTRMRVPRTWKVGTYRFFVYAVDAAGNAQSKVGSNRLIVR